MPTLNEKLSDQFNAMSRSIGSKVSEAQIKIGASDEMKLNALVQNHQVRLDLDEVLLCACCDCSYFQNTEVGCKHLWAAILYADRHNLLLAAREVPHLHMDFNIELFDDDDTPLPPNDVDDDDDFIDDEFYYGAPAHAPVAYQSRQKKNAKSPTWRTLIDSLHRQAMIEPGRNLVWPSHRQIVYFLDVHESQARDTLLLEIAVREPKRNGEMSKPKRGSIRTQQLDSLPDARDRHILTTLVGSDGDRYGFIGRSFYDSLASRYALSRVQADVLLPLLTQTGRFYCRPNLDDEEPQPLCMDNSEPWEFALAVQPDGKRHVLTGELRRGSDTMPVTEPRLICAGYVLRGAELARLNDHGATAWLANLRRQPKLVVPPADRERLVAELMKFSDLPPLRLPPEMAFETVTPAVRPCLIIKPAKVDRTYYAPRNRLEGQLAFDYDGRRVPFFEQQQGIYQPKERRLIRRDFVQERLAREKLEQLGFKQAQYYGNKQPILELAASALPKILRPLLDAGWLVEAEGKIYHTAGSFQMNVESGIDWFELHGTMKFGDREVALPDILKAIKSGSNLIQLGDGAIGMLPEDWLKKYGLLAGVGKAQDDHLRFAKAQVGLLDALLAAMPEASFDTTFAKAREELRRFEGIAAVDPPAEFQGELRPYQREGLGWFQFLQRFGFGGCLADDMGLGKTVQLLALLAGRRNQRKRHEPSASLVVVPKSLIFNWKQEAARFAPQLRVLDHTGLLRAKSADGFHDYDLILTTYGTLRRDALLFKDVEFDLCVLDEAQAVKNAQSESAKAVRLLQARHRLALSGTPIENHLGELWSLFEFLNPGMLGQASVFRMTAGAGRAVEPEVRGLLAKALRPFILRRTKEQVAKDLPHKTEQTLFCDLEAGQRKIYNELRDYYRQSLLGKIAVDGIKKSKIQVLEALLRLRQAACHPGLIHKKYADEESAKLDLLMPQLEDVFEEGHKALVFSQFTSLLALVRRRLDAAKVPYEYLDGKTRDRAAKVERFQNDPDCKLFLISLKAGGLGLNLTAAEYVYLLDPWWNPAVESQAIDRAHRIGQDKPVFAYRLIARDTVEEKVLELQKSKRELADAILSADNRLLADLSREDLEMLLT